MTAVTDYVQQLINPTDVTITAGQLISPAIESAGATMNGIIIDQVLAAATTVSFEVSQDSPENAIINNSFVTLLDVTGTAFSHPIVSNCGVPLNPATFWPFRSFRILIDAPEASDLLIKVLFKSL